MTSPNIKGGVSMTDNVIISIKGKQLYAESDPDEVELVTAGTLKRDGAGG